MPNAPTSTTALAGRATAPARRPWRRSAVAIGAAATAIALAACQPALKPTVRVSVANDGSQALGTSTLGSISSTGRYVVFASTATNLVPGDTNGVSDVFVRDLQGGTTSRVSVTETGAQANGPSYVTSSGAQLISANGQFVVFTSDATNLVAGDTNGVTDVFMRNRTANSSHRMSISTTEAQGIDAATDPSITDDGTLIAFESVGRTATAGSYLAPGASQTSRIWIRNRSDHSTRQVRIPNDTNPYDMIDVPTITADGRRMTYRQGYDAFVEQDIATGAEVARGPGGSGRTTEQDVRFSNTGRWLVHTSGDTFGQRQVYLRDTSTSASTLIAPLDTQGGAFSCRAGDVSNDGRWVSYSCTDGHTYLYDATNQTRTVISTAPTPLGTYGEYPAPLLSSDGKVVAFESGASTLVGGDTNGAVDVFTRSR